MIATKPSSTIRVLLAEDQTMLRGALAALLDLEPDMIVIAQAANGRDALKLARVHVPDVIVTDIEMPEKSGLELAAELKLTNSAARLIILTTFARAGYFRRALDAGARGYLLKNAPPPNSPKPSAASTQASAPSTLLSPPKPGMRTKILFPTASARYSNAPAMDVPLLRLPPNSVSPKAPSATTSPKSSPN
jgi:DNA-binding NarL/FixJ family response regulator